MHKKKTEEMEADHQEFTRLIRENQAILYDFIKCRILDKSLAQDVLQETLYIAYKKWDQLKEHRDTKSRTLIKRPESYNVKSL